MIQDGDLVHAVKEGRRAAFAELVERYQRVLLRVTVRIVKDTELAEDVVQEAFFKAYQRLNSFEGRSSFKSWLVQIALNTAKNKIRGRKASTLPIEDFQIGVASEVDSQVQEVNVREVLQAEIEQLPERQRLAVQLRAFEDLSFKEIAEVMDCPYDTAKANYRHGLMKLKSRLEHNADLKFWSEREAQFTGDHKPMWTEVEA